MTAIAAKPDLTVATDNTWPYEFVVLPLGRLFIDETYQRPLSRFVKRIVDSFEPGLIGTLIVNERSKTKFAVIDGQTRLAAMRQLGHVNAPCLVYKGLEREEEARLFARFQSERKNVSAVERYRAALVAGEPRATEICKTVHASGFVIAPHSNTGNAIAAVKALEEIYDKQGLGTVTWVLDIVGRAWGHQKVGAASNEILRGLAYFLARTENVNDEKLIRGLSIIDPPQLHTRAAQLRQGRGHGGKSPSYMAEAIGASYRRRQVKV